ncbi:MAG: hypothetical protein PF503_15665, partial [Desulfobacula sp.]|nr:hypothetical protein [Desulfobacula sp.]
MGPDATVDLMQRIIHLTPALDDIDHIRCIVDNNISNSCWIKGATTTMPKKPITTDGMEAMSSTMGFTISATLV